MTNDSEYFIALKLAEFLPVVSVDLA